LARNAASQRGGGIANEGGGAVTLTNSTLAYNTTTGSGVGGGINNRDGSVTLQNTILALNTAPGALSPSDNCVGEVTSLGTNLIGNRTGCSLSVQSSDLEGDPSLAPFADDRTPGNGHFPLQQTSRAINTGNDAACPRTDQLGQLRVGQCDIGAIEFQSPDTTSPTLAIAATPNTLRPPNGKMVPVTIAGTITDTGSGIDPNTATYAVSDEYKLVQPQGSFMPAANGSYTFVIQLQASRNGNDKDGRLYSIAVSIKDKAGNTGSMTTRVIVP
jgi:hypothetical protein